MDVCKKPSLLGLVLSLRFLIVILGLHSWPLLAAAPTIAKKIIPPKHIAFTDSFESETVGASVAKKWHFSIVDKDSANFKIVKLKAPLRGKVLEVEVNSIGEDNIWDIQMFHEEIQVQPNVIYNYSAWVKGPKEAEVSFSVENPNYLNLKNKTIILNGSWQQIAFEVLPEGHLVRTAIHFAFPYNFESKLYIDDVVLEESR